MNTYNQIDKMKVRRKIAIISFISIILVLFLILIMIFFGDQQVGENMLKSTGIISPIILSLTGIVVQYSHTAFKNDKLDKEQNDK